MQIGQSHPTGLTANLLKLFEPRPPLEFKPPPEKRKCPPYTGIGYLHELGLTIVRLFSVFFLLWKKKKKERNCIEFCSQKQDKGPLNTYQTSPKWYSLTISSFSPQGMAQFASNFAEPGEPEYSPPVQKAETPVRCLLQHGLYFFYVIYIRRLLSFSWMNYLLCRFIVVKNLWYYDKVYVYGN